MGCKIKLVTTKDWYAINEKPKLLLESKTRSSLGLHTDPWRGAHGVMVTFIGNGHSD